MKFFDDFGNYNFYKLQNNKIIMKKDVDKKLIIDIMVGIRDILFGEIEEV